MARTLDSDNTTAIGQGVTEPRYLLEMGFDTTVRYTSGQSISAMGYLWSEASFDVRLSDTPVLRLFNVLAEIGAFVLNQGTAGRSLKIYQYHRLSSGAYTDPILLFDGEMGEATITDVVTIRGRRFPPHYTPRTYVAPPVFNHLPRRGTVIEMPGQKITLE